MSEQPESIKTLQGLIGTEPVVTDWMSISQIETDVFSALTGDRALMHNDPEWAATSPWGGTIVQGYHVMALLPRALDALPIPVMDDDRNYMLNYGLDRVRVLSPLRVGHEFRIHTGVKAIEDKREDRFLVTFEHTVEIRGEERPFMVAEALAYCGFDQDLTTAQ